MPRGQLTRRIPPFPSAQARLRGFDLGRLPGAFGDWRAEVRACRTDAALFDFSCLITIEVKGPGAVALLEAFCARSLGDMDLGAIRYALTAGRDEKLISDVTIWRYRPDGLLVMTGRPRDLGTLRAFSRGFGIAAGPVIIEDRTAQTCVLALQGPAAAPRLAAASDLVLPSRFRFARLTSTTRTAWSGGSATLAKTASRSSAGPRPPTNYGHILPGRRPRLDFERPTSCGSRRGCRSSRVTSHSA